MENLLVNILLAMGIAAAPAIASGANFDLMGETDQFIVAIDLNSVFGSREKNEVYTVMKRTMKSPVKVKGKRKEGVYYIESTTVRCNEKDFTINDSALFSWDNEVLVAGKANKTYASPGTPGNFISDYIEIVCNTLKLKPSILI